MNGLRWGVQVLWRGISNLLVNLLWLLGKLLELCAWVLSEIAGKTRRSLRHFKQAYAQQKLGAMRLPLQWLLRQLWGLAIELFWLSIQFIELIIWYFSKLKQWSARGAKIRPQPLNLKPLPPKSAKIPPKNPIALQQKPRQIGKKPRRHRLTGSQIFYLLVVVATVGAIALPIVAFVPASYPFVGTAIVEELSFTYGDKPQSKTFIQGISGLQEIAIAGKQTFTLTGNFESEDNPRIDELNRLTIKLVNDSSRWSAMAVEDAGSSALTLDELRLRKNTEAIAFCYDRTSDRLSVQLNPAIRPNWLKLSLGSQPLRVTLEGYRIAELSPTENAAASKPMEFTFVPEQTEIEVSLAQPVSIAAIAPNLENASRWLADNLDVEAVQFYRTNPRRNEDIYDSTILEGSIRMSGRSLKIERGEFLINEHLDPLDIDSLQFVRFVPASPASGVTTAGIEVRFFGTAKKIAIASDPQFPEASIQASFLNQWLPPEMLLAALPLWAALLGYSLYWLVDNFRKIW